MKKTSIRAVRGTHDLFGGEVRKFNLINSIIKKFAEDNNYKEIQTPIFEFTDLFTKPLGAQSDVVLKEMYTFNDRNEELLTLRPEYTTPLIRAAITNNLLNELPLRIFGIGPMFRRERPQKGRYRQFNQINFEIFGTNDFYADLELIVLANNILKNLLPKSMFKLHINTLGNRDDLEKYKLNLSEFYKNNKLLLSEESKNKIETNPLRILDSKEPNDIEISSKAPTIQDFVSKETKIHFDEIKNGLKFYDIDFIENYKLVRGLDYYCSTVFEFKSNELGSQDTLLGGGRYDGLIKTLGGPNIPGIGWAAGVERISLLMENLIDNTNNVHLAITDEKFKNHLLKIAKYLTENKILFFWNYKYNLKKSLSKANSDKAKFAIIIGEEEFNKDIFTIKNLNTGNQSQLDINKIIDFLND